MGRLLIDWNKDGVGYDSMIASVEGLAGIQ